jgi:hypothetical protein
LLLPKELGDRADSLEQWVKDDAAASGAPTATNISEVLYTAYLGNTYRPFDSFMRSGSVNGQSVPTKYCMVVGQTPSLSTLNIVGVEKIHGLKDGRILFGFDFLRWDESDGKYWFIGSIGDVDGQVPTSSTEP